MAKFHVINANGKQKNVLDCIVRRILNFLSSNGAQIDFTNICDDPTLCDTHSICEHAYGAQLPFQERYHHHITSIAQCDSLIVVCPIYKLSLPRAADNYFKLMYEYRSKAETHSAFQPTKLKHCIVVCSMNDLVSSSATMSRRIKPLFELLIKELCVPASPLHLFIFRDSGSCISSSHQNNLKLFELDAALNRMAN